MSWLFGVNKEQAIPEQFQQMVPPAGSGGSGIQ